MKTTKFFNKVERKWVVIDAKDKILGRLSIRVAKILQGKNKAVYSPNFLCGDRVILINAKYVKFSANKRESKVYDKYTGYHNGRKEMRLKVLMEKNPTRVLYLAVKGMLPRNNLGARMLKSLKIYPEGEHKQEAQKAQLITV
ncbi:MAG: 50S ribosomal protein L13 [Candidatus Omnitrophica bacterium]|nr:50S ribosomal protein L13 [Candidatus Omnitrophota bacterium]